jgi:hypothetical protein
MVLVTPKQQAATDLAALFSTDLPWVEEIVYTPLGGFDETIPAMVERSDRLEPYVRGPETASCVVIVQASDVTSPQHGDRYTITNLSGDDEVWEFLREFESGQGVRKIALEREME